MNNYEAVSKAKCPHCKAEVTLGTINKETKGAGFFKQESMYSCPHCLSVLGFSRGKYTS